MSTALVTGLLANTVLLMILEKQKIMLLRYVRHQNAST